MGEEIDTDSIEARKERVLQAEEKRAILKEYDELCAFGYGRMEVVVVAHHLEGINQTRHMKRKDLLISTSAT